MCGKQLSGSQGVSTLKRSCFSITLMTFSMSKPHSVTQMYASVSVKDDTWVQELMQEFLSHSLLMVTLQGKGVSQQLKVREIIICLLQQYFKKQTRNCVLDVLLCFWRVGLVLLYHKHWEKLFRGGEVLIHHCRDNSAVVIQFFGLLISTLLCLHWAVFKPTATSRRLCRYWKPYFKTKSFLRRTNSG